MLSKKVNLKNNYSLMKLLQTNIFTPLSLAKEQSLHLIDVFDIQ
jgi:hypothetical protein